MWAARTVRHAWGLTMRLDGDSDTVAWPNDPENRRRVLEKGCAHESQQPRLLCGAAVLLSNLFWLKNAAFLIFCTDREVEDVHLSGCVFKEKNTNRQC